MLLLQHLPQPAPASLDVVLADPAAVDGISVLVDVAARVVLLGAADLLHLGVDEGVGVGLLAVELFLAREGKFLFRTVITCLSFLMLLYSFGHVGQGLNIPSLRVGLLPPRQAPRFGRFLSGDTLFLEVIHLPLQTLFVLLGLLLFLVSRHLPPQVEPLQFVHIPGEMPQVPPLLPQFVRLSINSAPLQGLGVNGGRFGKFIKGAVRLALALYNFLHLIGVLLHLGAQPVKFGLGVVLD